MSSTYGAEQGSRGEEEGIGGERRKGKRRKESVGREMVRAEGEGEARVAA